MLSSIVSSGVPSELGESGQAIQAGKIDRRCEDLWLFTPKSREVKGDWSSVVYLKTSTESGVPSSQACSIASPGILRGSTRFGTDKSIRSNNPFQFPLLVRGGRSRGDASKRHKGEGEGTRS